MELSKKNLTAVVKPYKASKNSPSLVITLPKFFTDMLNINLDTGLVIKLDRGSQQLVIDLEENIVTK